MKSISGKRSNATTISKVDRGGEVAEPQDLEFSLVAIPESGKLMEVLKSVGSEKKATALKREVAELIDHIANRTHYTEGRRTTMVAIAGGLMAAAIALVRSIIDYANEPRFFFPLLILASSFMLVALLTLIVYSLQTNFKYPFREIGSVWKWFYSSALRDEMKFEVPWYARISEKTYQVHQKDFENQWSHFYKQQVRGLSDRNASVIQDLRQLYVLHVNEKYKNSFLSSLRKVVSWGLLISLSMFVIAIVVTQVSQPESPGVSTSSSQIGQVHVRAAWRQIRTPGVIEDVNGQVNVLANIVLTNHGDSTYSWSKIVCRDAFHLALPFQLSSDIPKGTEIAVNKERTWIVALKMSAMYSDQIRDIGVE